MLNPTGSRASAVAANIGSHGLTMVALQEARQTTAADVVSALNSMYPGSGWSYVQANGATNYDPDQQILYRSSYFDLVDSGVFTLANPKDSKAPVTAPYAGFQAHEANGRLGQVFHVASVHFSGSATSSLAQNASTGGAAQVTANYLKRLSGPVIVAGDMRYGREPWGDRPGYVPAQPTFIRNGYYDAMASQSMHGQNYANVNSINGKPSTRQAPNRTGLGTRSDHILLRGFTGSRSYYNVVNWSYRGVVPSDHNLVFSDLNLPR
jgi:endonuclease/exonuclease/phosphatase family metal-dependent hydrolase